MCGDKILVSHRYRGLEVKNFKNKKLGTTDMKCNKCDKEANVGICTAAGTICEECHFRINPPTLELTLNTSNGYIYNISHEMMETTMELGSFQSCGWFLRKKKIRGIFAYLTMEYYGKVRCARCDNYCFPTDMDKFCPKYSFCGISRTKTPDALRVKSHI